MLEVVQKKNPRNSDLTVVVEAVATAAAAVVVVVVETVATWWHAVHQSVDTRLKQACALI